MRKYFLLITILFVLICSKSYAQTYGNEWINFTQKYVKIKISEEGIYKITYNDIINSGFQTGNFNPLKFKIFTKGIEIPLYITGTDDGSFDKGDLIYFYGNKNDASLDKVLYKNPNDLPNPDVNLYENENYYFLTYSNTEDGKRYTVNNESNTNLTPEPFLVAKERINLSTNYYPGEYILDAMSLSEYTEGEGYLGSTFGKGESQDYELNTPGFLNVPSYQPTVSFYVAGRSNASSTNSQAKNHHFRINNNNNNNNNNTLFDSLYRAYSTIRKTVPININSTNTSLSVSSIDDLGAVTDFQALGYIEIAYSRGFNLINQKNLTFSISNSKSSNLLSFTNSSLINPLIIEKNGSNIYFPNITTPSLQFSLKNTNTNLSYYLADLSLAKPVTLNTISFKNITPGFSKNYLIISSNLLSEGALAYKQYNESIGMPTALVYTEDLYNEFYYGFHHPIALRNYCNFLIEKGVIKPEYLLLLGKGYENSREQLANDLVPTMGYPGSDNMLTSGLNGSKLEPGLATGRIPAKDNIDIINYLDKLKVYNNLGNDIWRKKILHISGGKNISENNSFTAYQDALYARAKDEYFGAKSIAIRKNVANPITDMLTEQIVSETRKGAGLISFLGHGSSNTTEIFLGDADKLDNADKPTIYLINGCSTGAVFNNYQSLGEQFILQKKYGAIVWIGTTSEGVASYLNGASLNYYSNWFKNYYGSSIAKGISLGLKNYQNLSDKLNIAHTRQYILLGDPYVKFYSSNAPDYSVDENSITIPPNQTATSHFLTAKIGIKNIGKAKDTKLPIRVSRILPNNSRISLPDTSLIIFNTDTLLVSFNNDNLITAGNNKIIVELNPDNAVDELSLLNNTTSKNYFLPGNSIQTISPLDKSIVSNNLLLTVQAENILINSAEYLFEIDTTPNFNSTIIKKSDIITATSYASWKPNIIPENNTVYYWRARLNLPVSEGGNWIVSSFTFIKDFPVSGYNVAHIGQLESYTLENLTRKNPFGFNYRTANVLTNIKTRGDEVSYEIEKRFRLEGLAISYAPLEFDGISILALNPQNYQERFQYPSPYNYINPPGSGFYAGPSGQYIWDLNKTVDVDSLLRYLKQIPNGYHIIGYNGHNATFDKLTQVVKNEFDQLGLTKLKTIKEGEPYGFWVTKGDLNSVKEITADYSSTTPAVQQSLNENTYLSYSEKSGAFTSNSIGPAISWSYIDFSTLQTTNDEITVNIIGIDSSGIEKQVLSFVNPKEIIITNLSAKLYPYIKLNYKLSNVVTSSVPPINYLRVLYKPTPDISLELTKNENSLLSDYIDEGDSIKWNLGIKNLGVEASDSLNIKYILSSENQKIEHTYKLPFILNPGESKTFLISIPTLGMQGNNNLRIKVEQKTYTEQNIYNNTVTKNIIINKDNKPPIINVSFDGKQIINGEIVSSKPTIRILCSDENKFLLMNDTTSVEVYIKKIDQPSFKRIYYSSQQLSFTVSNSDKTNQIYVDYIPDKFEDGQYALKIKSKDVNGNHSGNDYVIEFEVVNKPSITNFYPYPNPVTDKMKFVFTLTGESVPDKIDIKILTATGKVIKEISKSELGNIRIGTNVTDFSWDCTDAFGDRLANGVYFYKVTIDDKEKIEHRNSAGDKYFKHQIGKIYILR
ncbi:MAG TPA: C25 family cysteine peptidase [Pelobium sp.]|nr:C25 family cysteine peptidase [Pelobium sp.]